MFKLARKLPWFRVLAIGKVALTARRHLKNLTPDERRRLATLARHNRSLSPQEREEFRELVSKLDARTFAIGAVDAFSPWPVTRLFR
jgi:hypothetical protein